MTWNDWYGSLMFAIWEVVGEKKFQLFRSATRVLFAALMSERSE